MAKADASPVVEKVTRTRTVPPEELQRESNAGTSPEFWSYVEGLTPDDWTNHVLYVHRLEPRATPNGEPAYIDRTYNGMLNMPSGNTVPFSADSIKEKFGGKMFRFILKRGREIITKGTLATEGAPRYPDSGGGTQSTPLPGAAAPDGSTQVAMRAIDAVGNQQPEAMRLAMDILSRTSEIVMNQAKSTAGAAPQADDLHKRVLDIALTRLLDPPKQPDPLEMFVKFKELMGPSTQSNGVKDTLDLISSLKNSSLINMGGRGGGLVEMAGQVLPSVANAAVEGIREWRMGMEAQERVMAMQRGVTVPERSPNPPQPAGLPAAPQPQDVIQPQPAAPAKGAAPVDNNPPFQWIETKIVEILKEPSFTIDQAVDEVLAFLYRAHPSVVGLLLDPPSIDPRLSPGEQGILQLFQHEVILQQIPVNPRLVEFIKKFVVAGKESEAERIAGQAKPVPPAAPKPSA